MAAKLPASMKPVIPFLQRANELSQHDPKMAYFCKCYALELGLKLRPKTDTEGKVWLLDLLDSLEVEKKELDNIEDGPAYVEGFALHVFKRADDEDRAGEASAETAKTFYAAQLFLETLKQFGDMSPELLERQRYAKWKAADILKALRDGRRPSPGPPGGDSVDFAQPPATTPGHASSDEAAGPLDSPHPQSQPPAQPPAIQAPPAQHQVDVDGSPSSPVPDMISQQPAMPPSAHRNTLPTERPPPPAYSFPSTSTSAYPYTAPGRDTKASAGSPPRSRHSPPPYPSGGYPAPPPASPYTAPKPIVEPPAMLREGAPVQPKASVGPDDIAKAQKFARFAVSALQFSDVKSAVENLSNALKLLS